MALRSEVVLKYVGDVDLVTNVGLARVITTWDRAVDPGHQVVECFFL